MILFIRQTKMKVVNMKKIDSNKSGLFPTCNHIKRSSPHDHVANTVTLVETYQLSTDVTTSCGLLAGDILVDICLLTDPLNIN